MMNIWIINQYASTPDSGMGGRHYYLARELAKEGHSVTVIAASYHHLLRVDEQYKQTFQEENNQWQFVTVNVPKYVHAHSPKRILNWLLFSWRLRKLKGKSQRPDVIICSSPSLLAYLGAQHLKKHFRCPLIFEVRDIWPLSLVELSRLTTSNPFICFLQRVEDLAYSRSDRVISNLPLAYKHIQSRGFKNSKFDWIPNGFSKSEMSVKAVTDIREQFGIDEDVLIVGYCGSLGEANNLSVLVEAAHLLRSEKVAFVLIGGGKNKEALLSQTKDLELKNIHFLPAVEKNQIWSLMEQFDVCYIGLKPKSVFRFGVSPNKLIEYFAVGKPVLYGIDSGDFQPVNEIKAGISVSAGSAEETAKGVLELYHMPAEVRKQLGQNGKLYAEKYLEYGKLADKLISVIENCIAEASL